MNTISIIKSRKQEFLDRLAKINKKLVKHNLTPITYTITGEYTEKQTTKNYEFMVSMLEIELVTPVTNFQISGYTFIGSITTKKGIKTMFTQNKEHSEKMVKFSDVSRCDHCHTKHNRNNIYVFEKDGNDFVIGSNCVKDFFGENIFTLLLNGINYIQELVEHNEEGGNFHGFGSDHSFEVMVGMAMYYLEMHNSYLKGDYDNKGTAGYVEALFNRPIYGDIQDIKQWEQDNDTFKAWFTDEKQKLVTVIQKYWEDKYAVTDFDYNIKQRFIAFSTSSSALVACGVNVYFKENNLFKYVEKEVEELNNEYLGVIGDKLESEMKVVKSTSFDGEYGVTYIYIFKTSNNQILKWFTKTTDIPEDTFKAKFTVKDHSEYKGRKETVVTRLKIIND